MKYLVIFMLTIASASGSCPNPEPRYPDSFSFHDEDKQVHLAFSLVGTLFIAKALSIKHVENPSPLAGIIVLAAGLAKEFVLDDHPSQGDLVADGLGCLSGVFLAYTFNF